MKILVACEFSGIVRDAFRAAGHDAWSCDLLPSEAPSPYHLQGNVLEYLDGIEFWPMPNASTHFDRPFKVKWDLMIAHPPCTHLAVSGARWFKDKHQEQRDALSFVKLLMSAPIPRIAIENPVSVLSTKIRKPDQIIQPWQFGHGETKAICLWLKNLPLLTPTDIVSGRAHRIHKEPESPERWKNRSRFYVGIAKAMANQWP